MAFNEFLGFKMLIIKHKNWGNLGFYEVKICEANTKFTVKCLLEDLTKGKARRDSSQREEAHRVYFYILVSTLSAKHNQFFFLTLNFM